MKDRHQHVLVLVQCKFEYRCLLCGKLQTVVLPEKVTRDGVREIPGEVNVKMFKCYCGNKQFIQDE